MGLFQLTEQQLKVQQTAKKIAQEYIAPIAKEVDKTERFPRETINKLAEAGILGCAYPREYGGMGGDFLSFVLAMEEISKVCGSTGSIVSTHSGVSTYCIQLFGTEEQKRKYLPKMIQGHLMGFALTEADAGSDASGIMTKAEKQGENYILNGAKMFISSAPANEFNIIIAATGKDEKGHKEFTAFVVDRDTPGFSVGPHIEKMGIRGSLTAEIIMENCAVHESQILGGIGNGMKVALASLDAGRISMGTQALGIAQGALDDTIQYVNTHERFGERLSKSQYIKFKLAELQTRVDAGRLLLWNAAALKDAGKPFGKEAAMGKLYNSDLAMETTIACVGILGNDGCVTDFPLERKMRDAKITQIYEGANEIQKIVIARALGIK